MFLRRMSVLLVLCSIWGCSQDAGPDDPSKVSTKVGEEILYEGRVDNQVRKYNEAAVAYAKLLDEKERADENRDLEKFSSKSQTGDSADVTTDIAAEATQEESLASAKTEMERQRKHLPPQESIDKYFTQSALETDSGNDHLFIYEKRP